MANVVAELIVAMVNNDAMERHKPSKTRVHTYCLEDQYTSYRQCSMQHVQVHTRRTLRSNKAGMQSTRKNIVHPDELNYESTRYPDRLTIESLDPIHSRRSLNTLCRKRQCVKNDRGSLQLLCVEEVYFGRQRRLKIRCFFVRPLLYKKTKL